MTTSFMVDPFIDWLLSNAPTLSCFVALMWAVWSFRGIIAKYDLRFEKLESRMEKVEIRLDNVEGRLDKVETRLDKVEEKLVSIDIRLSNLEVRFGVLEKRFDDLITVLRAIHGKPLL